MDHSLVETMSHAKEGHPRWTGQGEKVKKSESEVAQSRLTLFGPLD